MFRLKRSGTPRCLCLSRYSINSLQTFPRRIGIAPSLSLQQPVLSINTVTPANPRPQCGTGNQLTGATHPLASVHGNVNSRLINTMPNGVGAPIAADELGFIARLSSEGDEGQPQPLAEANGPPPRRRSRTGTAVPPSNRFTITNMTDNEFPDDSPHINVPGSTPIPRSQSPRQNQWLDC
jgi:hypothetical protein